jgi:ABC-type transport system substrate-binding protein/tRNA A-37 threonylcarbamoyl transferase component Bud32
MSTALTSGSVVAGFRISRLIGKGAAGAVYLAEGADGRQVALKVPIPELAHDERFRQRFLREAQIAAALDEPHVVPTVAFGEADGMLYLAMVYVDGLDLREILRREGPLAPERAVELIAQVAAALDAAHGHGLVHRDVKPGNVLVRATEAGEHAYLCDFGLAKHISSVSSLTGDRNLVGTIAYISPEQIEGGTIDARADVYSLGCMLFECLTGEAPFTRDSELAAVYAHMHEPPPLASEVRPEVPAAFDAVVATAMAKAPDDRFASCGALAAAAAAALRGEAPPRRAPAGRRRALWALAGVAVAVAAALVAVLVLRGGGDAAAPARLEIPPKTLGLVDARSHEVVGGIPFASQPWDVAFTDADAWVLLGDERRVARVDIASRKILSTATLPFVPGGIATGGGGAWVTEDGGDGLVRLDGTTGAIAQRFSIPARGDRSRSPTGVAFGAGSVWVARASETVRVAPRSGAVEHRFPTPLSTTSVVFAGESVWVAGSENGRIVRIDPVTNRITAVTPLHGTVTDLAVDRDSVWVSIVPDDVVFRLSPDDGSVLATIPAGAGPSTLSAGDGVWIADSRGREIVRVSTGGTRERLPTTGTPWAARYHDGLLWASVAASEPAASAATTGTLRIPLVTDDIGQADPAVIRGPVYSQLAYSTCAYLLNYPDAEGADGRELRPEVAGGMPAVSADGRTYRFRVRRGFRFSPPSGEEVTAETFRHTIERALSPRLFPDGGPNPYGPILADVEGATAYAAGRAPHIRGVTARGDTLTIRLTRPAGDLVARLSTSTFCPVPVGTPDVPGGGAATPIAMAGPYYVASAGEGQVVVEKNPNYSGSRPRRVERIVFTGGLTPADAVARVQRGGADYVNADILGFDPAGPLVPGSSLDRSYGLASRAGRAGRPRYVASPAPGLDGIAFNTRRPLFRDARMRRAVGYALDRTALAAVYGEQPSDHLIPPAVSGIAGNVAYPNDPDLTTARRLAGPGRRMARLYACGDPTGVRIAGIVRANLAPIGIDVRIDQSLGCLSGPKPERLAAADMQLVSHADHSHDPVSFVELPLGDRYTAPGYWRSPSLQRRIASARGLRGPARAAAYVGLETALVRDAAPVAVYATWVNPELVSERVGCRITQGALQAVDLGALCLG